MNQNTNAPKKVIAVFTAILQKRIVELDSSPNSPKPIKKPERNDANNGVQNGPRILPDFVHLNYSPKYPKITWSNAPEDTDRIPNLVTMSSKSFPKKCRPALSPSARFCTAKPDRNIPIAYDESRRSIRVFRIHSETCRRPRMIDRIVPGAAPEDAIFSGGRTCRIVDG